MGFALTQNELAESIGVFVSHTEAQLVSHDISPTDAINAIVKDNRTACMKMSTDTAGHFAKLAAESHSPRYLRFLAMISLPQASDHRVVITRSSHSHRIVITWSSHGHGHGQGHGTWDMGHGTWDMGHGRGHHTLITR
jgi:hypothetical protein